MEPKTKKWLAIGGVLLVIGGGVGYYFWKKKKDAEATPPADGNKPADGSPADSTPTGATGATGGTGVSEQPYVAPKGGGSKGGSSYTAPSPASPVIPKAPGTKVSTDDILAQIDPKAKASVIGKKLYSGTMSGIYNQANKKVAVGKKGDLLGVITGGQKSGNTYWVNFMKNGVKYKTISTGTVTEM